MLKRILKYLNLNERTKRAFETSAPVHCSATCDEVIRLRTALTKIEKWFGEFPPTGRTWDDGTPMSYGAAFGSNGERDYMRTVARNALSPND